MNSAKLLRYSMQLSMLKQLRSLKLISEAEYQLVEKKLKKDYLYVITLFATIMSIGASAFVSPDVFYVNTQNAFIFWTFLGYSLHIANKKRQEKMALKEKAKQLPNSDMQEQVKEEVN